MLRHIVMFKFSNRSQTERLSKGLKTKLLALPDLIPELLKMEVGLNINTGPSAFDLVLTSDFD